MRAAATVMASRSNVTLVIPRVFAQAMGFKADKSYAARWGLVVGSTGEVALELRRIEKAEQPNDMAVKTFALVKSKSGATARGESTVIRIPTVVASMLGWVKGTKVEWSFTGPEMVYVVERVMKKG